MEYIYAILCILGGAVLMVFAIGAVHLFNEWLKTTIYDETRELRRIVYTLSSDVNQLRCRSDVVDDDIKQLVKI